MSPTLAIILFVLGLLLFLVGLYLSFQSSRAQKTFEDAKDKLDEERADLERRARGATTKSAPVVSKQEASTNGSVSSSSAAQEEELQKNLKATRDKLSKQREKNQHVTRERDELKQRVKDLESAQKTLPNQADALVEMRMELAEARQEASQFKQQVERLERELAQGGSEGKKKKQKGAKEQPVAEEIVEKAVAPASTPEATPVAAEDGADRAKIKALGAQIKELEQQLRDQEREAKQKLKKQGRDVERQMRRADNNDKAYRITQKELDAARERVTMLTEQLERARFAQSSTRQAISTAAALAAASTTSPEDVIASPVVTEQPHTLDAEDAIVAQAAVLAARSDEEADLTMEGPEEVIQQLVQHEQEVHTGEVPALDEQEEQEEQEELTVSAPEQEDATHAPEEIAAQGEEQIPAPPVSSPEAATEVDRVEVTEERDADSLAEVSDVDEGWGDIDLDTDDEEEF